MGYEQPVAVVRLGEHEGHARVDMVEVYRDRVHVRWSGPPGQDHELAVEIRDNYETLYRRVAGGVRHGHHRSEGTVDFEPAPPAGAHFTIIEDGRPSKLVLPHTAIRRQGRRRPPI